MKLYLLLFSFICSCSSKIESNDFDLKVGMTESQLMSTIGPPYFTVNLFENGLVYGYKHNSTKNTYYDGSIDIINKSYGDTLQIALFHVNESLVVNTIVVDGPIKPDMFKSGVIRYFKR